MKTIKNILMAMTLLLSITFVNAQIKNAKTETAKIYGNCGMCKKTIETAANVTKTAKVDWNVDTKMASITYDTKKTNPDEILKRIALAGYDSDKFLAPDAVYDKLHGCCQYDREAKIVATSQPAMEMTTMENHANHDMDHKAVKEEANQLKAVFDSYFMVKDALVNTDASVASTKSKDLLSKLKAVQMDKLAMDVHMVWMKVMKDLTSDSKAISETQDVKKQRVQFMSLSKNMHDLLLVAKFDTPVYYQFCPMANGGKGANWLSKENAVKNPYYGAQMMTCGKVVETIK